MTLDQFDTFVGTVLLIYAGLVLLAGMAKFLSRHHVPSALHSTAEPASRAAEVDAVDGRAVVAAARVQSTGEATDRTWSTERGGDAVSTAPVQGTAVGVTPDRAAATTATGDSGGEVAVPASGRIGPTPDALLTTSRSREDPAVLGCRHKRTFDNTTFYRCIDCGARYEIVGGKPTWVADPEYAARYCDAAWGSWIPTDYTCCRWPRGDGWRCPYDGFDLIDEWHNCGGSQFITPPARLDVERRRWWSIRRRPRPPAPDPESPGAAVAVTVALPWSW